MIHLEEEEFCVNKLINNERWDISGLQSTLLEAIQNAIKGTPLLVMEGSRDWLIGDAQQLGIFR